MACACASVAPPQSFSGARLAAMAEAAAPVGALEYCQRSPAACGQSGAALQPALAMTSASASTGAFSNLNSADAPDLRIALFEALLQGESQQTLAWRPAEGRREIPFSAQMWADLVALNAEVNRDILPMTDASQYGVDEFWARPARNRGDCEDYALEKRARLIERGWAPETLSLAVVYGERVGLHTVLLAHSDQGDVVLDNMEARPRLLTELSYKWLLVQHGPTLLQWSKAAVAAAPADWSVKPPEAPVVAVAAPAASEVGPTLSAALASFEVRSLTDISVHARD